MCLSQTSIVWGGGGRKFYVQNKQSVSGVLVIIVVLLLAIEGRKFSGLLIKNPKSLLAVEITDVVFCLAL